MDADADGRLYRFAVTLATYSISIFFLLRAAGRFSRCVGADACSVAERARTVQRGRPALFRDRWREVGMYLLALSGPFPFPTAILADSW